VALNKPFPLVTLQKAPLAASMDLDVVDRGSQGFDFGEEHGESKSPANATRAPGGVSLRIGGDPSQLAQK